MLTAKSAEYDKVLGLDSGADDYITKPFGIMEFLSRVKAVLRRSGNVSNSSEISVGQLTMYIDKHVVIADGKEVALTFKEFELLKYLMENAGIVLTRISSWRKYGDMNMKANSYFGCAYPYPAAEAWRSGSDY